ncbi:MAG TPA: ABC transporter substrate-binding protein [Longimicrobiales bacterium]
MSVARRFRIATAPLALAALAAACGAGGDGAEPIHLGLAGPINLSSGRSMHLAAQMAVDEINRAGGIDGRPLTLVVKDDEANDQKAIAVATELRDDPRVVAVVGHINSFATRAAARIYNDEQNGVVELSPASTSPDITEAGPWTFRVCPSDLQHAPALAQWTFDRLGRSRAAVLYSNDAYGRGIVDAFATAFEEHGGRIIARDPFLPQLIDSLGVDAYLERAMRNRMDALVIAGQAEEALSIIRTARRLGYRGPVLGADGLTGLREAGSMANGVYVTSAFLPDRPTEEAQRFVEAYVARYNELPDHRGAMTYDAIYLLARALREVSAARRQHAEPGVNATAALRRAIRDYLAGVGTEYDPFEGVSGTIRFDENGDVAGKDVAVGVVQDGRIVTASS